MQVLLTKYWSVLLTLLSGAFFVGSWTTARATATAQAVQGERLDQVTAALADVVKTESTHDANIAVTQADVARLQLQAHDLSAHMDQIESEINAGKGKK